MLIDVLVFGLIVACGLAAPIGSVSLPRGFSLPRPRRGGPVLFGII